MRDLLALWIVTLIFVSGVTQAKVPVSVFACEPEWAALAVEVGGDRVSVRSAITARHDPRHVTVRPRLIAAIRKADLVFCTGAGLEASWLPTLLQKSGKKIREGGKGYLLASHHVKLLEASSTLDSSLGLGHYHAQGAPDIHLNPHNISLVAKALAGHLESIDKEGNTYCRARLEQFLDRWEKAIVRWEAKAQVLKNMPIAVQYKNWDTLTDWLGLKQIITLEPKPGLSPTLAHLEYVLRSLKTQPIQLIIHAPFEDPKPAHWLFKRSHVPEVMLPFTVGGTERAKTLELLFDDTLDRLITKRINFFVIPAVSSTLNYYFII